MTINTDDDFSLPSTVTPYTPCKGPLTKPTANLAALGFGHYRSRESTQESRPESVGLYQKNVSRSVTQSTKEIQPQSIETYDNNVLRNVTQYTSEFQTQQSIKQVHQANGSYQNHISRDATQSTTYYPNEVQIIQDVAALHMEISALQNQNRELLENKAEFDQLQNTMAERVSQLDKQNRELEEANKDLNNDNPSAPTSLFTMLSRSILSPVREMMVPAS